MVHPTSPGVGRESASSHFDMGSLTRDQRVATTRITNKFREAGVVQVLTGPRESGKSTVAAAVAQTLEGENQAVFIAKSADLPPNQKRLMQEAYGSYPYLLAAILKQLGFYVRGEEHDLVDQMVEQLRELRREEKRIFLVLDEAQDFEPEVWKRFQSWLDFQDGGIRMFQTLIVGSPEFKTKLADSSMRGWRRWIHARHELSLLSWKAIGDESRRILKQVCDAINARPNVSDPVTAPSLSWFAVRRIARESGGRPGRLTELVKRALSASIREGGCRISARFLSRADALRSPAIQMYRSRKGKADAAPTKRKRGMAADERRALPAHPLGWMRYALGSLLVLFVLGAGWGITAWLSIPTGESTYLADLAEEADSDAANETVEADPVFDSESDSDPFEYNLTEGLDEALDDEFSEWGESGSPWGLDSEDEAEDDGWGSLSEAEVAEDVAPLGTVDPAPEVASESTATDPPPLEIQMSEAPPAELEPEVAEAPPAQVEEEPISEIQIEQPAPKPEPVVVAPPAPPRVTTPEPAETKLANKKVPNKKILEHLSRMAKALE